MLIYIIRLQDSCYWVGSTNVVQERNITSKWLTLHPPLTVESTKEVRNEAELNKEVRRYMEIHGVDKVRGGKYLDLYISEYDLEDEPEENYHETVFTAVSKPKLNIPRLKERVLYDDREEEDKCQICGDPEHRSDTCTSKKAKKCTKCGRTGHIQNYCTSRYHVNGEAV